MINCIFHFTFQNIRKTANDNINIKYLGKAGCFYLRSICLRLICIGIQSKPFQVAG